MEDALCVLKERDRDISELQGDTEMERTIL